MAKIDFNITELQIIEAIEKARPGIGKYLRIMELFPAIDVSTHRNFQRQYNHFYKVRQKPESWYESYYSIMQELRNQNPSFDEVLDHLHQAVGSCEASFASKLVATLNPDQPVWDSNVLKNMGIAPLRSGPKRFEEAKNKYRQIEEYHREILSSRNGGEVVRIFEAMVPGHLKVTNLKKIEFVLWQTRPNDSSVAEQVN